MSDEKKQETVVETKHGNVVVRIHGAERLTQERLAQAFAPLVVAKARQQE